MAKLLANIILIGLISYVSSEGCTYISTTKEILCNGATYSEIQHFLENEPYEYNQLTVNSSTLKQIDSALFGKRSHSKITSVTFENNLALTKIGTDAFKSLTSIQKILITRNKISKINSKTFDNVKTLKHLDLSHNRISSLEKNAFSNLTELTNLLLNDNRITTLKANTFIGLKNLDSLNLSSTGIKSIKKLAFEDLTSLRELVLDNNRLQSLPDKVLDGLVKLESLDLSKNRISSVGDELFIDLENLIKLDFGDNQLKLIPEEGFKGLKSLLDLSLSDNLLKRFDTSLLVDTPYLRTLDISINDIDRINPEFLLQTVPNLKEINLTDNEFSCSELKVILDYFDQKQVGYTRSCNNLSPNELEHCDTPTNEYPHVNGVYCNTDLKRIFDGKIEKTAVSKKTASYRKTERQGNIDGKHVENRK